MQWSTLWMHPAEISSRYDVLLNLFIASIAFQFVIGDKLPQVPFLTTMDKFLMMSNVTILICAAETFTVFILSNDSPADEGLGPDPNALRVDEYCRYVIPLMYIVGVILLIARGLWIRQAMMLSADKLTPIGSSRVKEIEPHNSGYLEAN